MAKSATANSSVVPGSIRGLTITGKNVRFEDDARHFTVTSIPLEELTSCAAAKRSYEVFLALAIIVFAGGIILAMYDVADWRFYFFAGTFLSAILVFLFLVTRSTVLEFCSRGGARITISTGNLPPGEIVNLIDRVETAKEADRRAAMTPGPGERRPAPPRPPAPTTPAVASTPPSGAAPPAASTPPPATEKKLENCYWIARNGQEEGPLLVTVIKERVGAGTLTKQDYFLDPALNEWVPIERLPEW